MQLRPYSLYRSTLLFLTVTFSLVIAACGPFSAIKDEARDLSSFFCGGLGNVCCRAPSALANPAFGPLVACQEGLGCDITTNKCVKPCGVTGGVCCDGPETRAPKWTADGKVYSPNTFNMREMCDAGACSVQTHRCSACGTTSGGACCGPDAAQATARCIGDRLECKFNNDAATSGICLKCGIKGNPPCRWGCDPNLDLRNDLCDICGADMQPRCDRGCNPGLEVAQGLCRHCGDAGQIPCDRGCKYPLDVKNGVCAACGWNGQPPCDRGCNVSMKPISGVCRPCGGSGQPPCGQTCTPPMKMANGVCRFCGANGQIPCDSGCNPNLVVKNGLCTVPPTPPPPSTPICATVNEACVPDNKPGTHCCQQPGPQICNFGFCKACVPHGQVCALGGTQICCNASAGDVCKLDVPSGQAICDIPD
jgi:hypothetical protein